MTKTYQTIYATPSVSKDGFTLTVQPLQEGVIFEKNKPIQFDVNLTKNDLPFSEGEIVAYFKWNAKNMIWHQNLKIINGKAKIDFVCEQSGFGILFVHYYKDDVEILEQLRGVAISPEDLQRSYPCPKDFDAFWDTKKAQLNKPIHATYSVIDKKSHPHLHATSHKKLLEKDLSAADIHEVRMDCLEVGVAGILTRPKTRKPKSLPAILFLHGGGVSACDPSLFIEQASKGVMVYDINAHGLPNDQPDEYYKDLKEKGALFEYHAFGRNSRDDFYFLDMYLRVKRALDFLKSLPEWDQKVLITFGGSQGAAQAYAGAYLDEQVSAVVGQIPAYGDLTGFLCDRTVMFNDWLKMEPRGKVPKNILEVAPYFDMANFLRNYRRDALFCLGLLDLGCTPITNFIPINECPANATVIFQSDCYHNVCSEGQAKSWEFIYNHIKKIGNRE